MDVAKLAGLPDTVVTRAFEIAANLRKSNVGNLLSKSGAEPEGGKDTAESPDPFGGAQGVLF
ncbi:hypothetical protein FACS1894120_6590 [Clostridia bacterium]|nr:hypothetical protein FACS1894120_6590 [Clostridia bacterium]